MGQGFVKIGGAETDPADIQMVEDAWAESAAAILSGDWDLVVLDEINYAIGYKMLVARGGRRRPPPQARDGPRHPDRPQRPPTACRARRHRHRDARSETRLPERHSRAARHRILTHKIKAAGRRDLISQPAALTPRSHAPVRGCTRQPPRSSRRCATTARSPRRSLRWLR